MSRIGAGRCIEIQKRKKKNSRLLHDSSKDLRRELAQTAVKGKGNARRQYADLRNREAGYGKSRESVIPRYGGGSGLFDLPVEYGTIIIN